MTHNDLFTYTIERASDVRYVKMKIHFDQTATKSVVKSQLSNIVNVLGNQGNVNELIIYYFDGSTLLFNPPGHYEFYQRAIPDQELNMNNDREFIDVIEKFIVK